MIGLNKQCETCRHLERDYNDGRILYECAVACILDEDEERDCPDWEENRWWEDVEA